MIFLVQADAEGAEVGRWPLLSPWLHSSALPGFAVISVVCALAWSAVRSWLADYEEHAQATVARALRLAGRAPLRVPRPAARARRPAPAHLRPRVREPPASADRVTPRTDSAGGSSVPPNSGGIA